MKNSNIMKNISSGLMIMMFISLVLIINFFNKGYLGCLGVFGLTYLISKYLTKNIIMSLFISCIISILFFSCDKNIEGLKTCEDNYLDVDFLIKQSKKKLEKKIEDCEARKHQINTDLKLKKMTDKQKNKLKEEIKSIEKKKILIENSIKFKKK